MLYYSFFQSYLSYGILLWGPTAYSYHINKITIQQKKAVRFIKNCNKFCSTRNLFKEFGILDVSTLVDLEILKIMYKIHNDNIPGPIKDIFSTIPEHNYSTRCGNDPQFKQKRNTATISNSFICKGPTLWTQLNADIKNSVSLKSFMKKYKRHIINQ